MKSVAIQSLPRALASSLLALLPFAPAALAQDLSRLQSLTAEQATELVRQGKPLRLSVTELSPEVAAILAGAKGELRFDALAELTAEAAAAVAKSEGVLALPKLAALTPAVAAALGTHRGDLALPAVTTITPDVAAGLAPLTGQLVLGVTELSDEAAAALAKRAGDTRLDALTSLTSLPLAERIGRQTVVSLGSVSRVTTEIIRALCPPVDLGNKSLNLGYRWIDIGLTELSPEAGAAIVGSRHGFGMHRLETISPEAAAAMSGPFTNMRMWGLKTLSPAAVAALAKGKGILDIRAFGPEFDDDAALALAKQMLMPDKRQVDLSSLKRLSCPELAIASMRRNNNRTGPHGGMPSVAEITAEVARTLAECPDEIIPIPSLASLTSAALAAKYAAQPGDVKFGKLAAIPDDVAAALAKHKGKVDLSGLRSLSVAAATAFAAHEGDLLLDGLEELGDEAAAALAKAVGPVSLKRLAQLSPAARAALAGNPKIALPPAQAKP